MANASQLHSEEQRKPHMPANNCSLQLDSGALSCPSLLVGRDRGTHHMAPLLPLSTFSGFCILGLLVEQLRHLIFQSLKTLPGPMILGKC